jgi:hypothetical protein
MAETSKTPQAYPSAGTLTPLYAVPTGKRAMVSSLLACNQARSDTIFRVSIAPSAAADTASQYIYYDHPLHGSRTFVATIGLTLPAGTVIRVYTAGTVSFCLSVLEKDA